jgi:1-acyl-sn-glycerol-3-phosphate acyltransferase
MEANAPIWEVSQARPAQRRAGLFTWVTLVLPFVRRLHGLEKIDPRQRYILVANHVSLLDALILCGFLTREGRGPVLVLADKTVWTSSVIRRWLSRSFGFLVERGKFNPARLRELQAYGAAARDYHLLVFPEGTRGNGVDVAECQPGIYYIAQAARVPILPIFLENMHKVSTKTGRFHLIGGLKKVEIHFGEPVAPENYANLPREEFTEFIRKKIIEVRDQRPGGCG